MWMVAMTDAWYHFCKRYTCQDSRARGCCDANLDKETRYEQSCMREFAHHALCIRVQRFNLRCEVGLVDVARQFIRAAMFSFSQSHMHMLYARTHARTRTTYLFGHALCQYDWSNGRQRHVGCREASYEQRIAIQICQQVSPLAVVFAFKQDS